MEEEHLEIALKKLLMIFGLNLLSPYMEEEHLEIALKKLLMIF